MDQIINRTRAGGSPLTTIMPTIMDIMIMII